MENKQKSDQEIYNKILKDPFHWFVKTSARDLARAFRISQTRLQHIFKDRQTSYSQLRREAMLSYIRVYYRSNPVEIANRLNISRSRASQLMRQAYEHTEER